MKEKLSKEETGFSQIKNAVIQDKTLSWKARGLFAYLYSKPNDWDFAVDRIARDSEKDGFDSTTAGIKELEDSGYLIRKRRSDGRKDWFINYSQLGKIPSRGKPNEEKTHIGKIPTVSNKENSTNKEIITNKVSSPKIPFEEFWNAYDKKIGKPKTEKKWNKLSLEEQKAILEYIPKYKIAQPNKKYRKNPETFLNNRSWEDELIMDGKGESKGTWKCEYGHMHKRGEECGHALERRYQNSDFSEQLKNKFQIKR